MNFRVKFIVEVSTDELNIACSNAVRNRKKRQASDTMYIPRSVIQQAIIAKQDEFHQVLDIVYKYEYIIF